MCISTEKSALVAAVVAAVLAASLVLGPSAAVAERVEALDLEAALASGPDLYLVLRVEPPELEIRARGLTLDQLPLAGVAFLESRPAWSPRSPDSLSLPFVWIVAEPPVGAVRRQIEPESLEPFDPEELARAIAEPEPDTPHASEHPATYRVPLRPAAATTAEEPAEESTEEPSEEEPWTLEVRSAPRSTSGWTRPLRLLADGWRRLWAEPRPSCRVLSLTLDPDAARALHRQLQQETRVLVLPPGV